MEERVKQNLQKQQISENQSETQKNESGVSETWAEDAKSDLADWIEEQGIQLRY